MAAIVIHKWVPTQEMHSIPRFCPQNPNPGAADRPPAQGPPSQAVNRNLGTGPNNFFLWCKSEDMNKKRPFPKFWLIQILCLQVMHDYSCMHWHCPIDYCVKLSLVDKALFKGGYAHFNMYIFSLLIDWPWPLKCILWSFTLR